MEENINDSIESGNPDNIDENISMDDTIRNTLKDISSRSNETKEEEIKDEVKKEELPLIDKQEDNNIVYEDDKQNELLVPNTWKKEASAKWNELPLEVKNEISRREADFHKGIEQYKQSASFGDSINRAIQPYMATINSLGIPADQAISALMTADHKLRYGSADEKKSYFMQLAKNYGVDLQDSQNNSQQENEYVDPNILSLKKQISDLNSYVSNQQLMSERQYQDQLNSEILKFSSDPKNSHFETVKNHMAALLQAGQAKDLSDAYDQAVFANPTTRAIMLQQQIAAQKEEAAKAAKAAKEAASINMKARTPMQTTQKIVSMDDTIRETLRRLQGGV